MTYIKTLSQHPFILFFAGINLAIGYWAHRKTKAGSFEDYAIASKSLPTGVLMMTILATFISTRDISIMDIMPIYGITVPTTKLLQFILPALFLGTFIAPRLVFFNEPTFGGVMNRLYGKWAQLLTGSIHIFFSLVSIASQIATIGLLSKALWGIDFSKAVFCFGSVVVIYSFLGGMRAVSYTDVLQLLLILFVFFWLSQKVIFKERGIGNLWLKVSQEYPDKVLFRFPFKEVLPGFLYWDVLSFAFVLSPPLVHRMLMVRDKSRVRRMWYTSILIYSIIFAMIVPMGLFCIRHQEVLKLEKGKNWLVPLIQYLFKGDVRIIDFMALGIIGVLLSTMDSYLHTMGIIVIKDVMAPIQTLMGRKKLSERKELTYVKIGIFSVGILAVLLGSQTAEERVNIVGRKLLRPAVNLQVILTIPFILGVIGLKTDKVSFLSFIVTYMSTFYTQKFFIPWHKEMAHKADYSYFLLSLLLAVLAYLVSHIYLNQGIATVTRGQCYTAHRVMRPSWEKTRKNIIKRVKNTFNLPRLAQQETFKRPPHVLVFSILIFSLYALSSGIGMSKDEYTINFIMFIYLIGMCLCAGLMLQGVWSSRLQAYFPLYWLSTVFFCLPLSGTLLFLRMHEGLLHSIFFCGSFVILSFLVSSSTFIWMSIWGISLAWGGWYIMYGTLPEGLWYSAHITGYIALLVLALCVLFFGYYLESYTSQQLYFKKVFGDAIAHESKQPLTAISALSNIQENSIKGLKPIEDESGTKGFFIPKERLDAIGRGSEQIRGALKEIQLEFRHFRKLMNEEISEQPKEKVAMKDCIDLIVDKLPKKYIEHVKPIVLCKKDFHARVMRAFFPNVLTNFFINARKHGLASEMVIQIDGEKRQVRVRDNGRGIPREVLPNIFKFRFTTGGGQSEGIGLAFVKLILDASNIKIDVISQQGEKSFTEFILTFPTTT